MAMCSLSVSRCKAGWNVYDRDSRVSVFLMHFDDALRIKYFDCIFLHDVPLGKKD